MGKENSMKVADLAKFNGQMVAVFASKDARNSFATQLSVEGTLQQHPEEPDAFRVVVSDGIYSYFKANDVENEIAIAELFGKPDHKTKTGCKAVLRINSNAL